MSKLSSQLSLTSLAASLLLLGCGGGSNSSSPEVPPDPPQSTTADVTFNVSDAPVDNATSVVIAFDKIELVRAGEDNVILEVSGDNQETYRQIDLLQYQGADSAVLLADVEMDVGIYDELILHVIDESTGQDLSYVIDNSGQVPLKQPSQKLRLGGFEVSSTGVQSFTIEFDLRRSLVQNMNGQRYILKPHGVSIIDNGSASSLSGLVDINLFNAGECNSDTGNYVYLYAGHGLNTELMVDNFDPEVTQTIPPAAGALVPINSVSVNYESGNNGSYAFGFIPAGDYTVTFTCSAEDDDPEQYNEIIIPNPTDQLHEVILTTEQNLTQDFNQIQP